MFQLPQLQIVCIRIGSGLDANALQMNDQRLIGLASACRPTQAEARSWAAALRAGLPSGALGFYGIGSELFASLGEGRRLLGSSVRWLWFVWSLHHCPTNLADAFTICTWGRFNPQMPQDYRSQALRLLNRKSGPRGSGKGGRAWVGAKAERARRCYLLPGIGLPALL